MYEPLKFTVSKNRSTVVWTILMVIGITGYIAGFVSMAGFSRSVENMVPYFFFIGTAFIIGAFYVFNSGKQELLLTKNASGEISISIKLKGEIEIELKNPFSRKTYMIEVYTGAKGPVSKMPELYLIFLDESDKPILTLKTTPGALADIPKEFIHVEVGSFAIGNVYTCIKLREFSFMLNKRETQ